MKICSRCKIEKKFNDFSKCKNKKDGLNIYCKVCLKEFYKQYYSDNKDKINKKNNKWRETNKQYFKQYHIKYDAEYRINNKDKISQQYKQYRKHNKDKINQRKNNCYKTNPTYRLNSIVSGSIKYGLMKSKCCKNGESKSKYLPYTMQKLKDHLQSQFEPWMSWNNHGKYNKKTWKDDNTLTWFWQIDHIIPHSTFKYTSMEDQEFKDCWSLSNLRPLSAKQNYIDGVTRSRHGR